MSLLDDLAAHLAGTTDTLPLPELRRAVGDIHRATDRLRQAVALGTPSEPLSRLGVATAHLESSVGLLLRAQDEVASYLATIGAGRPGAAAVSPAPVIAAPLIAAPAGGAAASADAVSPEEHWWALRVSELTGERVPAARASGGTPGALLRTVAAHTASGSRAGLGRALVTAGPGVGLALSGEAAARMPGLLAAWLGRPVRPDDYGAINARASFAPVLPGLPLLVRAALVSRACGVDTPGPADDPAGYAVGAAVLACRVAVAVGRSLDDSAGGGAASTGRRPGERGDRRADGPAARGGAVAGA